VTDKELQAAKQNLIGGFPLRIDSNAEIANYLTLIGAYRLPLDYLHTFTKKIEAVTVTQIREAYQRYMLADQFLTVTVGSKQKEATTTP
jgi:zinc protease